MNKFMAKLMQKIHNKLPENRFGNIVFGIIVNPIWKFFSYRWMDQVFNKLPK